MRGYNINSEDFDGNFNESPPKFSNTCKLLQDEIKECERLIRCFNLGVKQFTRTREMYSGSNDRAICTAKIELDQRRIDALNLLVSEYKTVIKQLS